MHRALLLVALLACSKKSSSSDEAAAGPAHAEHQSEVKISVTQQPDQQQKILRLFVYLDPRPFGPTIELTGTKKPITKTGEKNDGIIFEIPFDELGPPETTYKIVYDTFSEHGETTFKVDTTPPLKLDVADRKRVNTITAQWMDDSSTSQYFRAEVTPDRKLVFDFVANPGATVTLEGTSKPATAEPVRFELDIAAKAAELTLADTLSYTVKLEDPGKRVIARPFQIKARVLLEVLVFAKPGPYLFPGETAGPHHTIGAGVEEKELATLKLREVDRFARETSTAKELAPCRYVPEGVTDPKDFERYTVHREVVTSTVTVYDRRAGKVIASKSWTGKPEKCASSVEAEKGSFGTTQKFTAGTAEEIEAFVAGVR